MHRKHFDGEAIYFAVEPCLIPKQIFLIWELKQGICFDSPCVIYDKHQDFGGYSHIQTTIVIDALHQRLVTAGLFHQQF